MAFRGAKGWARSTACPWGPAVSVSPRLVVADDRAVPLARYRSDRQISSAQTRVGHHTSIFLGDMASTFPVLGRLLEGAGVHRWTRKGEVVQTDGDILMIHSGLAGVTSVSLPVGVDAQPITTRVERREGETMFVPIQAGDTVWFRLRARRQ